MAFGSFNLKTSCFRSSASLCSVTLADHLRTPFLAAAFLGAAAAFRVVVAAFFLGAAVAAFFFGVAFFAAAFFAAAFFLGAAALRVVLAFFAAPSPEVLLVLGLLVVVAITFFNHPHNDHT